MYVACDYPYYYLLLLLRIIAYNRLKIDIRKSIQICQTRILIKLSLILEKYLIQIGQMVVTVLLKRNND